jgi:pilus assembly protein CpaB
MRPQTVLVVLLAIVCGGSAVVGIKSMTPQEQGTHPDTVPVVVCATDIPPFGVISPEMVKLHDWPKDLVPDGAVTKLEDAIDRPVLQPMSKGETLIDHRLAPRGAGRGMATKVPKGMRAFTIHTPNIEAGVAGFILPGNKVDVLLTLLDPNPPQDRRDVTGGGSTGTLLQNVEILAIEQRVVAPAESKVDPNQLKSVTLLVTPQEAAKLTLGQSKGKLCLALRNHGDNDQASTVPVHVSQLLGDLAGTKEQPKPQERPALPIPIRTLRGNQEGVVLVQPGAVQAPDR